MTYGRTGCNLRAWRSSYLATGFARSADLPQGRHEVAPLAEDWHEPDSETKEEDIIEELEEIQYASRVPTSPKTFHPKSGPGA